MANLPIALILVAAITSGSATAQQAATPAALVLVAQAPMAPVAADQPAPPPQPTSQIPSPTGQEPSVVGEGGQPLPATPAPVTPPPETKGGTQKPAAPGKTPAEKEQQKLKPDQIHIQADKTFMTDNAIAAQGHVIVQTDRYTLHADVAEIDRVRNVAQFRGHVVIEGDNQRTEGDSLRIDLNTGAWKIEHEKTEVQPKFFTKGVVKPLYLGGDVADYDPAKDIIKVLDGSGTSCDLPNPHYDLKSSNITVHPGDLVTFRKPTLYLLGHRLFRYPFNLTMSLKQRQQNIIPEIGRDQVNGNYLKLALLYMMSPSSNGVLRLQMTQNRGPGLGFDHVISTPGHELDLSFFDEPKQGALSTRISDTWHISQTLTSQFNNSYQSNSGYSFSSSTLSNDLTLRRSDASSDTSLGFTRSMTSSDYGSSGRFGSTFTHSQRFGSATTLNLRSTYTDATYGGSSASNDKQLAEEVEVRHQAPSYDADFDLSNTSDLSENSTNGLYALNKLPYLSLSTDTRKLGGWKAFGRAYTRMKLEIGQYAEQPSGDRVGRLAWTGTFGGSEYSLGPSTKATTTVQFRQSFYDNGDAQYSGGLDAQLRHSLTKTWMTRLTYDYTATRGVVPLRLDYGGQTNEARVQLVRLVPNRSRLQLDSGYDFISSQFFDIRGLFELRPSDHLYLRAQTSYSLQMSQWWPLVLNITQASRNSYANLTFNYNIDQGQLSTVTANTDFRFGPFWRLEFVGSYSGFTHQIDQADVRLTRDLHCLIAQLNYSTYPRNFSFAIGIKAFPGLERTLGIGQNGAYMPGGGGLIY